MALKILKIGPTVSEKTSTKFQKLAHICVHTHTIVFPNLVLVNSECHETSWKGKIIKITNKYKRNVIADDKFLNLF